MIECYLFAKFAPKIVVVKKTFRYSNVFLTTTYAAIP